MVTWEPPGENDDDAMMVNEGDVLEEREKKVKMRNQAGMWVSKLIEREGCLLCCPLTPGFGVRGWGDEMCMAI